MEVGELKRLHSKRNQSNEEAINNSDTGFVVVGSYILDTFICSKLCRLEIS